jgi:Fic family protein
VDELRIVLKREEDIRAFREVRESLALESNAEVLRRLIDEFKEHQVCLRHRDRIALMERLRELEEQAEELEAELKLMKRYVENAEKQLAICILRRNPEKVYRLRRILEVARQYDKRFSAKQLRLALGAKMPRLRRDLKELVELGLLAKPRWGRYALTPEARKDDLLRVIAEKLAKKKVEKDESD